MNSPGQHNNSVPPVAHELKGSQPKFCSRSVAQPNQPATYQMPQCRNASGLQKIADGLHGYPELRLEDKQLLLDLAAALMNGELTAVRKVADRAQSDVRRLAALRDILAVLLAFAGQTAIELVPNEVVSAQLQPGGKNIEAIYVTLRCTRTQEAIGIPSHIGLPVQVYRMLPLGNQANNMLQADDRADPNMVFRRLSGLMAHSDATAPPPWENAPWQQ
jgi:hypothetical protein